MSKKLHLGLFTVEIFLIAANMRIAIIGLPPLVQNIKAAYHLSNGQMGALTSIPLLCFGITSVIIGSFIPKIGSQRALVLALILLALANFFRIYAYPSLLIGTALVGLAIATLNLVIPVLIMEWAAGQLRRLNGVYTAAFNLCAAIAGGLAVPLATQLGWAHTVQLFSLPPLLALLGWFWFMPRHSTGAVTQTSTAREPVTMTFKKMLHSSHIWLLALFMGAQSAIFYTLVAWLPTIFTARHVSAASAGVLLAIFQFSGIPGAYLVPQFTKRRSQLRGLLLVLLAGYALGFGCLYFGSSWSVFLIAAIILGLTTAGIFSLTLSLITLLAQTAVNAGPVGGFVQSIGYLIASVAPTAFGGVATFFGGWQQITILLMIIALCTFLLGRIMVAHLKLPSQAS